MRESTMSEAAERAWNNPDRPMPDTTAQLLLLAWQQSRRAAGLMCFWGLEDVLGNFLETERQRVSELVKEAVAGAGSTQPAVEYPAADVASVLFDQMSPEALRFIDTLETPDTSQGITAAVRERFMVLLGQEVFAKYERLQTKQAEEKLRFVRAYDFFERLDFSQYWDQVLLSCRESFSAREDVYSDLAKELVKLVDAMHPEVEPELEKPPAVDQPDGWTLSLADERNFEDFKRRAAKIIGEFFPEVVLRGSFSESVQDTHINLKLSRFVRMLFVVSQKTDLDISQDWLFLLANLETENSEQSAALFQTLCTELGVQWNEATQSVESCGDGLATHGSFKMKLAIQEIIAKALGAYFPNKVISELCAPN